MTSETKSANDDHSSPIDNNDDNSSPLGANNDDQPSQQNEAASPLETTESGNQSEPSVADSSDSLPVSSAALAAKGSGKKTSRKAASTHEPQWLWSWTYPLNTFLMVAAGISLYSASSGTPVIGSLALIIGICGAIPFGYSVINPDNIFSPHLARINKIGLILLALLPIWQMNSYLLENTEIPIIQHLVSLLLLLALCCLVIVLDRRARDYDNKALTQHLALRAIDTASWVYSFSLGIVFALITCLIIRVVFPGTVFDIKLLSRGLIPPLTLMLFFAGITDLFLRFWSVFSQSREKNSALNLLLKRLQRGKRETILETIYTCMDRSGELNRYLVWAIPILGFIGTVLGISLAAQGMGSMLTSASQEYSEVLTEALEPLGIAFDTTLIALSLSLVLALAQSLHGTWLDRRLGKLIEVHSRPNNRERAAARTR